MRVKDENKRRAIYSAAMQLVTENGLAGTSMSKIAHAAEVSPSTLYVYFENKEDMLNKLYLMVKEESAASLFEGFDRQPGTREKVARFLRNLFAFYKANPVLFSFSEQFLNSPTITQETRDAGFARYTPLNELYASAVAKGELKSYPIRLLRAILFAPIYDLVRAYHFEEFEVTDEMVDAVIEFAWRSIEVQIEA